jgi:hypothetical protein
VNNRQGRGREGKGRGRMGRFWLLPQGQGSSSSSRTTAPSAFSFIRSFFLSSDTNSSPLLNHLHLPSSTHCHVLCLRTCHNSVIEPSAVRYISTAYTPRYYLVDSGVASAYRQGERIRERGEQANRSKLIAISPHAGQRFLVSALVLAHRIDPVIALTARILPALISTLLPYTYTLTPSTTLIHPLLLPMPLANY